MDLHAYTKTISDLLSVNKKYVVPRFQREYSWAQDEISELWKDIIQGVKLKDGIFYNDEYFIGSLVLIGEDKSFSLQIVDGQQRLTTITILLSALVETFKAIDKNDFAEGLYIMLEGKDVSNKPFFKLENETPKPFFQKAIQNYEKQKYGPTSKEEELLRAAFEFYMKKLQESVLLKDYYEISGLNSYNNEFEYINLLLAIRDQILQLKTIFIVVAKEDDAYTIFETLNARGMNLTVVDLVKNEIFKALKTEHPNDDAKDKWKKIKSNLNLREEKVRIDTYFRHFWLSKYEFTTEEKIYKSFKNLVNKNKIEMGQFLEDLIEESENYKKITDPILSDWKQQEEKSIYNSLIALNIFRVTQARTLLIALVQMRKSGNLKLPEMKKCLSNLENFHFIFSAICSSRASGLESKFSKVARTLREAKNYGEIKNILSELYVDLNNKIPDISSFKENFRVKIFTDDETRFKKLIQYIFKKQESYLQGTNELEISEITLEHILSQSKHKNSDYVGKIGNLLPLAGKFNGEADTKPYKDKITEYKKSKLEIVKEFVKNHGDKQEWTQSLIDERTDELAELAYNQIWKIEL